MEFEGFIFIIQLLVFCYLVIFKEFKNVMSGGVEEEWGGIFTYLIIVALCWAVGKGVVMLVPSALYSYIFLVQTVVFLIHWILVLAQVFLKLGVFTAEKFEQLYK